jgi:hypothetical protein
MISNLLSRLFHPPWRRLKYLAQQKLRASRLTRLSTLLGRPFLMAAQVKSFRHQLPQM